MSQTGTQKLYERLGIDKHCQIRKLHWDWYGLETVETGINNYNNYGWNFGVNHSVDSNIQQIATAISYRDYVTNENWSNINIS